MRKMIVLTVLSAFLWMGFGGTALLADTTSGQTHEYSIMRPDPETLHRWLDDYQFMEQAHQDTAVASRLMEAGAQNLGTSMSLLSRLKYTPAERNQSSCGDCWVWSGTGVMEIDLDVQKGIYDRLSTQFLNSCKTPFACCGGSLDGFAGWYSSQKEAIPWSNTNASFKDGSTKCSASASSVSCSSISTTPNYPITSISAAQIVTQGVSQSTAIANIKNVLQQNKAVDFGFYLANNTDWQAFYDFWGNQPESAVWDPDSYCGHTWISSEGGGHAVLIVGYDDSASTPYWIVLNSWGTTSQRPNGLFRMKMNMDYSCIMHQTGYSDWYSREFATLNIQWGASSSYAITSPTPGSTLSSTAVTFQWNSGAAEYWLQIGSSAGGSNYYNSGSLGTSTSATATGLPSDGSTVYVRLWYRTTAGGSWAYTDCTYKATSTGSYAITSPTPGSTLTSTTVTFQWNSGAAEYWLYAGSSAGGYNYYESGSLGTSTSTTATGLPNNGSTVYVRLWYRTTAGGSWAYTDCTYTATGSGGGGFNEQFKGAATNWLQDSGAWRVAYSEYYYTAGTAGYSSASTYNQTYSNLDYSAKLWRYGSDSNSNRLVVRASGSVGSDGHFSNEYVFQYDRAGSFSVYKYVSGVSTALQAWTSSSAINQGNAWNTLRVVAVGSSFYYYINGTLVWSGSDASLASGRVGVGMYLDTTSSGDGFYVDWATLTVPSTQSIGNIVSQSVAVPSDDSGASGNSDGASRDVNGEKL